MTYILLALAVLFLDLVYTKMQDNQKKYVWFLACFLMWFIVGFRGYRIGNDTIGYVRDFKELCRLPWSWIADNFEKDTGFYYLTKAITLITKDPTWYLAITAFLSLIGVFVYIGLNTNRPVLALFFFVTLGNFYFITTGIRQSIAMSLCLLALYFTEKKNPVVFAALVILAAQCHKSAWIFMLSYLVAHRKITPVNMLVNIVGVLIAFFTYDTWFAYANEVLEYKYDVENVGNGLIFFVIVLIITIIAWVFSKDWIKTLKDNINMNMTIITAGMWLIRLFSRTIERPAMYWLTAVPVTLTSVIQSQKSKKTYIYVCYIAIAVALLLFVRRSMGTDYNFSF